MNTGITIKKVNDNLEIKIAVKHEIVDECFTLNRLNVASEGKRLIMEVSGKEYENYVKSLTKDPYDLEYLNNEFSKVKLIN